MFPVFPVLFPVCSQSMWLVTNDVPSVPSLGRARAWIWVADFVYRFQIYWEQWEQSVTRVLNQQLTVFPVSSDEWEHWEPQPLAEAN